MALEGGQAEMGSHEWEGAREDLWKADRRGLWGCLEVDREGPGVLGAPRRGGLEGSEACRGGEGRGGDARTHNT